MLEPRARERREVEIIAENTIGSLELVELNEEAALAYMGAQGIKRLHPVKVGSLQIAVR
jgi:hypothetical protein